MRKASLFVTSVIVASVFATTLAQTPKPGEAIVGAWTINKGASDLGGADGNGDGRQGGDDGQRGDGSGRGGRRRGGGGGGGGGGGFGGNAGGAGFGNQRTQNQEAMQRMRDALRQEMQAPDHMTIVSSETTVIITTPDGHTTRLSLDGKKIKDESTGIERKTKWDGGKLVSEVDGLGRGKITETYTVDDTRQLRVKLDVDGPRKTTQTRVYELDAK
jgi:hypothetical protein